MGWVQCASTASWAGLKKEGGVRRKESGVLQHNIQVTK